MATTITVSGWSDDVISIDGDLHNEYDFQNPGGRGDLLRFSDGTVIRIEYGADGVWRISPIVVIIPEMTILQATGRCDDDTDAVCTDVATLTFPGDISDVRISHGLPPDIAPELVADNEPAEVVA